MGEYLEKDLMELDSVDFRWGYVVFFREWHQDLLFPKLMHFSPVLNQGEAYLQGN